MFHSVIELKPQLGGCFLLICVVGCKCTGNSLIFISFGTETTPVTNSMPVSESSLFPNQSFYFLLIKSTSLWFQDMKSSSVVCEIWQSRFSNYVFLFCLPWLQHGALGFPRFSSSSSPSSHTTIPMPYFRGNHTHANATTSFFFPSQLLLYQGHIITEMPISGKEVSMTPVQCWVTKS